jgi:hypothetical protein
MSTQGRVIQFRRQGGAIMIEPLKAFAETERERRSIRRRVNRLLREDRAISLRELAGPHDLNETERIVKQILASPRMRYRG